MIIFFSPFTQKLFLHSLFILEIVDLFLLRIITGFSAISRESQHEKASKN